MAKKFKQEFIIKALNVISKENLGPNAPIINPKDSSNKQNASFVMLVALGKNFIMSNIDNVIRYQLYNNLKAAPLTDKDFGFWKGAPENGTEMIYENSIAGSARTGNIFDDVQNISPEPASEIQAVEFNNQYAVDLKANKQLQSWATLPSFINWLNARYSNMVSSIDKISHNDILNFIDSYVGYFEIAIDTTGLTGDEIALQFEKVLGETVAELTTGYTNDKNEEVDGINFDNLMDSEDIGAIISNKNYVNREINYLRKQRSTSENAPKDWGLGTIINKKLSSEDTAILLPKQKFNWGSAYGSITSSFGFALIESLKTDYLFWGYVMMKSAPAVRITAAPDPVEKIKKSLTERKSRAIANLKKLINNLKDDKTELDNKSSIVALKQLEDLLDSIKTFDILEQTKNIKVIKGVKAPIPTVKIINDSKKQNPENEEQIKNLKNEKIKLLESIKELSKSKNEKIKESKNEIESLKTQINTLKNAENKNNKGGKK